MADAGRIVHIYMYVSYMYIYIYDIHIYYSKVFLFFIYSLKDIYEFLLIKRQRSLSVLVFALVPRHISFVFEFLFALLAGEKLDWPIAVFDSHVGVYRSLFFIWFLTYVAGEPYLLVYCFVVDVSGPLGCKCLSTSLLCFFIKLVAF